MPWDKIDAATHTLWDKTANFNKAILVKRELLIMINLN
jgi:carboxyl-terminal processing protease